MKSAWNVAAVAAAVGSTMVIASTAAAATTTSPAALPIPVSTGHSQWAWGSPSPQGQILDAVNFQGATGYAVGAFGTVLSSDDGGQSWTGRPSGTTASLNLVQELSPTTVIAAGGCSVIVSTNSGASFSQMPLGLGNVTVCQNPVVGIAFSSAQDGYIELRDGTLLATTDGGAAVQVKTSVPVGSFAATGLAFSSATTGLAVTAGGLIERTTDGGTSWTQVQSVAQRLSGVTIVSPTLAYAVGDGGLLLESTDGGVTWARLPLALSGGGTLPDLTSITCADADDCLIATSSPNTLVRTTDGGQTAAIVTASNQSLNAVAYTTGTSVVGVGEDGAMAISGNAGQTFSTISSELDLGIDPTTGKLTAGLAPGSAYLTENNGIAATTNAGRSWSLMQVPGPSVASVAFTSDENGFALGGDGVLRHTTDGGVAWSAFALTHSPASTLVAPSAHGLLLVGPRGVFLGSHGGASFQRVGGRLLGGGATVASLPLNTAFAVPGGSGAGTVVAYRSTSPGSIIVSSDGGRRWRAVAPPPHPARAAIAVAATSASRLWVLTGASYGNRLWATVDGGRRWQALSALGQWLGSTQGQTQAGTVSFSTPRDGVVLVGAAPAPFSLDPMLSEVNALRTTNGGRTWAPEVVNGTPLGAAQSVIATSQGDIAELTNPDLTYRVALFTTAGTTAPASSTRLRVGFAHSTMSASALARAGHRVLVTGRVGPVLSATEQVAVSFRVDGQTWQARAVRVASNGVFRLTVPKVYSSAQVVAQAVGTSGVAGAGTAVASFSVRR